MTGLAGTGRLLRLGLRRDRLLIALSVLGLAAFVLGSAQATASLYPDLEQARSGLGSVLHSPAMVALYGPASDATLGGLAVLKTALMGAVLLGMLAYAIVRRHTRVEEEGGLLELVGAASVGRQAALTAASVTALIVVAATSVICAVGLIGLGFDAAGSVAFGCSWLVSGLVMIGVTAVAAQLTGTARGCTAWALGALGVMYVLRAIGDTATGGARALSWLSPLGWVSKVSAYDHNRVWVLALAIALAVGLLAVAYALLERRDLGAGLLPARPGPAHAGRALAGATGLVARLVRPTVIGWTVASLLLGAVIGSLASSVLDMMSDRKVVDMLTRMGGIEQGAATITQLFVATELRIFAVVAALAGVSIMLRLAAEEREGRSEPVLSTPTSRTRWYLVHAGYAWLTAAWLIAVVAVTIGVLGHRSTTAAPTGAQTLVSGVQCMAAAWVSVALAALICGLDATRSASAWAVVTALFVIGEFGTTMRLPDWLIRMSPYGHTPVLPMGSLRWAPFLGLTLVAVALTAAGLFAFRRRDLG